MNVQKYVQFGNNAGTYLLIIAIILIVTLAYYGCNTHTRIYLDNNGTTQMFPEALNALVHAYKRYYGNASAVNGIGADSKRMLESCRQTIANLIGCATCELFFTSGATESNNIAIRGIYSKHHQKGKHVIMTSIEHPSVHETVESLEGAEVTILPVDVHGRINLQELQNTIRKDTIMVCVIMGNNEIGTLQDIHTISQICQQKKVHLHCDMTQVIGKYKIDLHRLGVSSACGSGHKFHGPKATGLLFLKQGTYFESCISGGHQEKSFRAGTENVPGIVAMSTALTRCHKLIEQGRPKKVRAMRDWLEKQLGNHIPKLRINGHPQHRLYNTISICTPVSSFRIIGELNAAKVYVNTGSACSKGEGSRILKAIHVPADEQHGSIRISLSYDTTWADCKACLRHFVQAYKRMQ